MVKLIRLMSVLIIALFCNISVVASAGKDHSAISLDLDHVSLADALQLVAKFLDINLIINSDIQGEVSLHLKQVSANEALDTLLISHDLTKRKAGNAWIIETLSDELLKQQQQLKLQETDEQVKPLLTRVWQVRYAKAEEIASVLQDSHGSLLSKRGYVRVDSRTNSICVQDTLDHLQQIYRVIRQLDIPVQQVLIEARLASIDIDFEQQLGLHFSSVQDPGRDSSPGEEVNFSRYGLAIAKLTSRAWLDIKLTALENEGHGELISSPSLFTANQKTAFIESGEEIPYQEVSRSGATGVAFRKAVLSLRVTPHIMPRGGVLLELQVNQDKASNRVILGVPAISTRQISTNVLVKNGQTIVLGGIYESNKEDGYERLPFLSKIPVVGRFFQQRNQNETKRELLIFVTPKIFSQSVC